MHWPKTRNLNRKHRAFISEVPVQPDDCNRVIREVQLLFRICFSKQMGTYEGSSRSLWIFFISFFKHLSKQSRFRIYVTLIFVNLIYNENNDVHPTVRLLYVSIETHLTPSDRRYFVFKMSMVNVIYITRYTELYIHTTSEIPCSVRLMSHSKYSDTNVKQECYKAQVRRLGKEADQHSTVWRADKRFKKKHPKLSAC